MTFIIQAPYSADLQNTNRDKEDSNQTVIWSATADLYLGKLTRVSLLCLNYNVHNKLLTVRCVNCDDVSPIKICLFCSAWNMKNMLTASRNLIHYGKIMTKFQSGNTSSKIWYIILFLFRHQRQVGSHDFPFLVHNLTQHDASLSKVLAMPSSHTQI